MKKLITPLVAFALFASFSVQAQNRTDLKGPEAKNYKPWANEQVDTKDYIVKTGDVKTGPEAKNAKPWAQDNKEVLVLNMESKKDHKKGPEAKNAKPWNAKSETGFQLARE